METQLLLCNTTVMRAVYSIPSADNTEPRPSQPDWRLRPDAHMHPPLQQAMPEPELVAWGATSSGVFSTGWLDSAALQAATLRCCFKVTAAWTQQYLVTAPRRRCPVRGFSR
jgi:hypothetical protein